MELGMVIGASGNKQTLEKEYGIGNVVYKWSVFCV